MINLLGKTVCWILRRHKWRRLRKSELQPLGANVQSRICNRCHAVRAVKERKVKP